MQRILKIISILSTIFKLLGLFWKNRKSNDGNIPTPIVENPKLGLIPEYDPFPDPITEPEIIHEEDGNDAHTDDVSDLIATSIPSTHINQYRLPQTEYVTEKTKKSIIGLHHTLGWNDPYRQVDIWCKDKAGRVGTHFVIGGINAVNGDTKHDAVIVQALPLENWIYQWGIGKTNAWFEKMSVGIELCNFGPLTKSGKVFKTWAGQTVQKEQVIELSEAYRGHKFWHNYSDGQIDATIDLIGWLGMELDIDVRSGLLSWLDIGIHDAFAYKPEILTHKALTNGIVTHGNLRPIGQKSDIYPHPKLIKKLLTLK